MGKGLNILIIGLPLFAKRLAKDLSTFDKQNTYTSLNTYYSKKDKIKYFLSVRNADIVYSINGTLTQSRSIDLALKSGKKVIMHWVGTDVIESTKVFKHDNFEKRYIDECIHWCEVDWIRKELNEISIDAEITNFASYPIADTPGNVPDSFSVLSYVSQSRPAYYGLKELFQLAKDFPMIQFNIMGCKFQLEEVPNLHFLGWVDDSSMRIGNSTVCIRYTEHDGLSNFVLEALSKGKRVLYNNSFPATDYCCDYQSLHRTLKNIYASFLEKKLEINREGFNHIRDHFSTEVIMSNLIEKFNLIAKS